VLITIQIRDGARSHVGTSSHTYTHASMISSLDIARYPCGQALGNHTVTLSLIFLASYSKKQMAQRTTSCADSTIDTSSGRRKMLCSNAKSQNASRSGLVLLEIERRKKSFWRTSACTTCYWTISKLTNKQYACQMSCG